MNLIEIEALADKLEDLLTEEATQIAEVAAQKEILAHARATALLSSEEWSTAKNDRTADAIAVLILAGDESWQEELIKLEDKQAVLNDLTNRRKGHETYISLVKAWLYSQGPKL